MPKYMLAPYRQAEEEREDGKGIGIAPRPSAQAERYALVWKSTRFTNA